MIDTENILHSPMTPILFGILFIDVFLIWDYRKNIKISRKNKDSRDILIVKNGDPDRCLPIVKDFTGKYAHIEEIKARHNSLEDIILESQDKTMVVLLCRIGDRMELYQESMISKLWELLQERLAVIYITSKESHPYHVKDDMIQLNINLERIDEELIIKTLKESLNLTPQDEEPKLKVALIFLAIFAFLICWQGLNLDFTPNDSQAIQNQSFELSVVSQEVQELRNQFAESELEERLLKNQVSKLENKFLSLEEKYQILGRNLIFFGVLAAFFIFLFGIRVGRDFERIRNIWSNAKKRLKDMKILPEKPNFIMLCK